MIANYHTHSKWCRHAEGTFGDYFNKAESLGFVELAMTDHVPHKFHWSWFPWEDILKFDEDLNNSIKNHEGKLRIIKGFEGEYFPKEMECYKYLREELGYDFLVMGQHNAGRDGEVNSFWLKTEDEFLKYGESVCEGLNTGYFKLLAHPDVPFVEYPRKWDKTCERVYNEIFSTCESLKIPVEINVNGFRENRGYPNADVLELSKKYKLTYLINTDAHNPEHLYDEKVRECEEWVKSLGIEVSPLFPWEKK